MKSRHFATDKTNDMIFAHKPNAPNPVTHLEWTHIFEWCGVRCESTDGHQKVKTHAYTKETQLHELKFGDE